MNVTSKVVDWLFRALYLVPFAGAVWFVARFSVDVPITDQWGLSNLFGAVAARQSLAPHLLACNNEHPILFPKLIWIALAFATKWNTRVDMMMSLLLALVMFIAIATIARSQSRGGRDWIAAVSIFVAALCVFSFVHYDTWLWGFQLNFVLTNTCVVLAVYSLWRLHARPPEALLLAWCLCAIASFSELQGMLAWLVVIPMYALLDDRRRAAMAVLGSVALCGVSVALYFLVFTRAHRYPVDRSFWHYHPIAALEFLFALLGAPLAHGTSVPSQTLAPVLGAVLIGLFVVGNALLVRAKRLSVAAPWISMGLFGIGFALMTTFGRSAWGVGLAAAQSRYMSASVLLTVAVLELFRQALAHRPKLFVVLAVAVGTLSVAGTVESIPIARNLKQAREHAAAYLEVERYIDPATDNYEQSCLFPLFPVTGYTGRVRVSAETLDTLGFRKVVRHVPFVETPSKLYGEFDFSTKADQAHPIRIGDAIRVSGWAVVPGRERLPKFVLISVGDARVFIMAAWIGTVERPDAARMTGMPQALKSGWSVSIPAAFLPAGESTLTAWVYDAEQQEFVRLNSLDGDSRVYKAP